MANGDAFLTKPGKTIFMAKKIIKKLQKLILNFLQLEELQMQDLLKKFLPVLNLD